VILWSGEKVGDGGGAAMMLLFFEVARTYARIFESLQKQGKCPEKYLLDIFI